MSQRKITPTDTMVEAIALSSPSGRMSKRARARAEKRLRIALFGDAEGPRIGGLPEQPNERECDLRKAAELRELAERGMRPRAFRKLAAALEAKWVE